jgi:hypothetical protein
MSNLIHAETRRRKAGLTRRREDAKEFTAAGFLSGQMAAPIHSSVSPGLRAKYLYCLRVFAPLREPFFSWEK